MNRTDPSAPTTARRASGLEPWHVYHVYHVYMVRCGDGTLYTGIARDVARRLAEHAEGRGAKYLRGRGPLELVLKRRIGALGLALSVEHALKRLPRARKEELVLSRARVDALVRERRRASRA